MADQLTIAIFGANGAVGHEAVKQAAARGHRVISIEHSEPDQPVPGVEHRTCDVLDGDVRAALKGADAVLSCLGVGNDPSTLLNPPPLYTQGTQHIMDAMKAEGIRRLVVISASFVDAKDRGPLWFRFPAMTGLANVFDQMEQMERYLERSDGIDWTAVRPGWLMAGDLTEDYTVQADVIPEDQIRTRHADLAHFMLNCVETGDWIGGKPAVSREEPASASSPDKVVADMVA